MMSHLLLASTTSWSGVAAARRKVGFPPTNPHTSRTRAAASQHAHPQQRTGRLPACVLSSSVCPLSHLPQLQQRHSAPMQLLLAFPSPPAASALSLLPLCIVSRSQATRRADRRASQPRAVCTAGAHAGVAAQFAGQEGATLPTISRAEETAWHRHWQWQQQHLRRDDRCGEERCGITR
jgi:hypothetical protein